MNFFDLTKDSVQGAKAAASGRGRRTRVQGGVLCGLLACILSVAQANIVINEIHYNPDVKTEHVEFVELYNTGPGSVDLAGWYFSDGVNYTFPAGTSLPAGGE